MRMKVRIKRAKSIGIVVVHLRTAYERRFQELRFQNSPFSDLRGSTLCR